MAAVGEAPEASSVASDSSELAGFGYKQELDRSLGSFSSFAAGFSYISILTGVTALFATGYLNAGPGVWWTWPVVVGGQILVALCFMEMAGQYPIAGSVYQWSKQISSGYASWMTGWIYIVGAIVTIAAVAVDWQVVLPQITTGLQFFGTSADAGATFTKGGAQNALLLGTILIVITTIINMLGVKLMSRINNVGVMAELIGSTILVILLLFNAHHGPQIIFHSYGFGAGHPWGYFGALLVGGLLSAYVMYGFDTAGTLAEETNDPRRNAPPAIIRAIGAAAIIGGLVILFAIDGQQAHPRQERRASRPSLRDEAGVRKHNRQHLPGRLRARDLRLLPRRSGGDDPDAVLDVARQQAAVRLAGGARVRTRQGARSSPRS